MGITPTIFSPNWICNPKIDKKELRIFRPPFFSSCPLAPKNGRPPHDLPSPSMDAERDCQLPGQLVELIMDGFIAIVAQALK